MKQGWDVRKLGDLCKIGDGNHSSNYPKSSEMVIEGIPFIRANNMVDGCVSWNDMKFITKEKHTILKKGHLKAGDILFTNRGAIGKIAIVGDEFEDANLNSQIAWFRCLDQLKNRFLYYLLLSPSMQNHYSVEKNGAALQQFTIRQINDLEIPLPPLQEQQRIVAILDEAFAAIAQAKANAEQNLQNAKELFESYLQSVFENKGDDWEEKALGEMIEIKNGKNQQAVLSASGEYKIMGSAGNVMGYATNFICEAGTTIIGRKGNISNPIYINERFWNVDTAFGFFPKEESKMDKRFVYYLCLGIDFKSMNRGTTIPSLVKTELQAIKIAFPPLQEQQAIVERLDALCTETKQLEVIYQQKINDLDELKKSILQKAFAGELNTSALELEV